MRANLLSLAVVSLTALAGCADTATTGPRIAPELARSLESAATVTELAEGPWARIVEGKTGPGSLYAIYIPRAPNATRDVVYYAHGFRDAESPIDLRDQDALHAIRNELGAMGFTVAYSSYSENGLAVKDGGQRTHQLRGLVASQLGGQPGRSFLVGHSLGGAIALQLAETYPDQYDGALLMCGMVGGSLVQTQYVGNVRALVDFYFPKAFPGGVLTPPAGEITAADVQRYFLPLLMNPDPLVSQPTLAKLFAIASTKQAPLPFVLSQDPSEMIGTLVGSVAGALNFHSRGIANILELTNGHTPFDNTSGYSWAAGQVPSFLFSEATAQHFIGLADLGVPRHAFDPSAENYLARNYTPTGNLRIPVLTVHNAWDPAVPIFHQTALRAAVTQAGAMSNLRQQTIPFRRSLRHCDINASDAVPAFQALLQWVASRNAAAD